MITLMLDHVQDLVSLQLIQLVPVAVVALDLAVKVDVVDPLNLHKVF